MWVIARDGCGTSSGVGEKVGQKSYMNRPHNAVQMLISSHSVIVRILSTITVSVLWARALGTIVWKPSLPSDRSKVSLCAEVALPIAHLLTLVAIGLRKWMTVMITVVVQRLCVL